MIRAIVFAAATLAATGVRAQETTAIQLPGHVVLTGVLAVDVDRDGRDDLVLACRDTKAERREIRVHLRAAEAPWFAGTPSRPPHAVETDVVAFTFADVTPAPGRELVLFAPERAVAVEPDADGATKYVPLFTHDLVWPVAEPAFVLPLTDATIDLDGDGQDEVLVPQTDGAIAWRRNGGPVAIHVPPRRSPVAPAGGGPASIGDGELRLSFGRSKGDRDGGPLVSVRTRTPTCRALDLDGDGRRELVAIRNGRVFATSGDAASVRDVPLPLPADRLKVFDPAFDVQFADLDGDRRADLVLTTSASRDDEIEVRIDTFVTRADGTWGEKASGRLRMKALAVPPRLADVDGDGRVDLITVTVQTDALRSLTGGAPTALEAQLNVFRGGDGRFVAPAVSITSLRLPTKSERGGGTFVELIAADAGGTGAVLLRDGDTLQRRPFGRDGERLQLLPPTTTVPIPAKSRLDAAARGEVLVLGEHELLHVRTR